MARKKKTVTPENVEIDNIEVVVAKKPAEEIVESAESAEVTEEAVEVTEEVVESAESTEIFRQRKTARRLRRKTRRGYVRAIEWFDLSSPYARG